MEDSNKIKPPYFRLLPIVIFLLFSMITVRVGDLWIVISDKSSSKIQKNETIVHLGTNAVAQDKKNTVSEGPEDTILKAGQHFSRGYMLTGEETIGDSLGKIEGRRNFSKSELNVLENLSQRREDLDSRERQLEQKLTLINAAETQIERKILVLKEYEKNIKELLGQYEKKEEERLDNLVNLYSSMKPKDAARIFEELEMSILIALFEKMKNQKAAAILAELSPQKAKALTTELAVKKQGINSNQDTFGDNFR